MATAKPAAEEAVPEEKPEEKSSDAVCANCGEPAVLTTDGASANVVSFCEAHVPVNLR